MMPELAAEPVALRLWVLWLVIVNSAAVLFVRRRVEARWILLAWVVNLPLMHLHYEVFGYERILGAAHIAVWAPLVVYLWQKRALWLGLRTWGDRYVAALLASNTVSLAFDYVDVIRFLLGRV